MVGLAYGIDRPRLAVIGVTPRYAASWAPHAEARARTLLASPYGRAIGDPVHWRGRAGRWLLDHVAVFGLRYAWKDALLGRPPASREPGRYDPRRGFRDVERRAERAPREPVTDWEITEAKKAVLAGAVECLRRRGAEVFLAQTPVHPEAIASFPSGPGGLGEVPGVIADVARRSGAHALLLPGSLRFGQGEFRDSVHLNAAGAARYSDWLAQELEQAVGPRG